MPTFKYIARDSLGKKVQGIMDAETKEALAEKLHKMGHMATKVLEVKPGKNVDSILARIRPISTEDMIVFYTQFSNMISAGISILDGLDALGKQLENTKLREAVAGAARNIEGGDSLSKALNKYPNVFPKLLVSMIKAGEISGKLDNVLIKFSEFAEAEADLKEKIKGALFYPLILLTVGIGVTLFIVTFVVPQFAAVYSKAGITLPLPTIILNNAGMFIKDYWYSVIVVVFFIAALLNYYAGTKRGRLLIDRIKLDLPVIGPLYRKTFIARFTKTLGTLLNSGVPILESLSITKEVIGNEVLAHVIEDARNAVEKGERLSEPLKISSEFPPATVQMIAAGEKSGTLDTMLDKISEFYEKAVGYAIKKLTTIIEPIFITIMGGMVGFIMISLLLPMFDMIKILKR